MLQLLTANDDEEGFFGGPPTHHHGDARELSPRPTQVSLTVSGSYVNLAYGDICCISIVSLQLLE